MSEMQPPPSRPKGRRPQLFADPAIDQLHAAFVALATELAVAFDRSTTQFDWTIDHKTIVERLDLGTHFAQFTDNRSNPVGPLALQFGSITYDSSALGLGCG